MRGSETRLLEMAAGVGREVARRGNRGARGKEARVKDASERGTAAGTGTEERMTGTGSEDTGAWTETRNGPERGRGPITDVQTRTERETETGRDTETGPGRGMEAGLGVLTEPRVAIVRPAEKTPPLDAAGTPLPCPLGR